MSSIPTASSTVSSSNISSSITLPKTSPRVSVSAITLSSTEEPKEVIWNYQERRNHVDNFVFYSLQNCRLTATVLFCPAPV